MTNIPVSERSAWIGSSESAALLGVSPYTTRFQLWHEKRGTVARPSLDGIERIEAGRFLEPAIAAWAGHKWSWPVGKVTDYLVHARIPRMGASLDFETIGGEPVEIKNVDRSIFLDPVAGWIAEGDAIVNAPVHFLVQVQHQLACRPFADRGWLVACVGGNALYRMSVERHAGIIARIEREVAEFWRSVDDGVPPPPDFGADGETLSLLYPRGNGRAIDLSRSNRAPLVCAEYLAAAAEAKAAGERRDAALAEIKALVEGASLVTVPGYRVSISDIPEAPIAPGVRRAYRRFTIKAGAA